MACDSLPRVLENSSTRHFLVQLDSTELIYDLYLVTRTRPSSIAQLDRVGLAEVETGVEMKKCGSRDILVWEMFQKHKNSILKMVSTFDCIQFA